MKSTKRTTTTAIIIVRVCEPPFEEELASSDDPEDAIGAFAVVLLSGLIEDVGSVAIC
jgi:hypothetical protein